jgi:hypothetical protein
MAQQLSPHARRRQMRRRGAPPVWHAARALPLPPCRNHLPCLPQIPLLPPDRLLALYTFVAAAFGEAFRTPEDLGVDRVVSEVKADFQARPVHAQPGADRQHLHPAALGFPARPRLRFRFPDCAQAAAAAGSWAVQRAAAPALRRCPAVPSGTLLPCSALPSPTLPCTAG